MHASATLHIDADPQRVWELISDITRMGSYSPEVFEAEWLDGGTDVTESFRLADNLWFKVWRPLGGFTRENRNRRDMLRTLEAVRAVAETG